MLGLGFTLRQPFPYYPQVKSEPTVRPAEPYRPKLVRVRVDPLAVH